MLVLLPSSTIHGAQAAVHLKSTAFRLICHVATELVGRIRRPSVFGLLAALEWRTIGHETRPGDRRVGIVVLVASRLQNVHGVDW